MVVVGSHELRSHRFREEGIGSWATWEEKSAEISGWMSGVIWVIWAHEKLSLPAHEKLSLPDMGNTGAGYSWESWVWEAAEPSRWRCLAEVGSELGAGGSGLGWDREFGVIGMYEWTAPGEVESGENRGTGWAWGDTHVLFCCYGCATHLAGS